MAVFTLLTFTLSLVALGAAITVLQETTIQSLIDWFTLSTTAQFQFLEIVCNGEKARLIHRANRNVSSHDQDGFNQATVLKLQYNFFFSLTLFV